MNRIPYWFLRSAYSTRRVRMHQGSSLEYLQCRKDLSVCVPVAPPVVSVSFVTCPPMMAVVPHLPWDFLDSKDAAMVAGARVFFFFFSCQAPGAPLLLAHHGPCEV